MFGHCDRTHARASSTVGDAEGFMQVHVADISTNKGGLRKTRLGIKVCAIHVYLTTGCVHLGTDGLNACLEDAVGGWVGDHKGTQTLGMLRNFCL